MSDQYWYYKSIGICYICRERPVRQVGKNSTCAPCAAHMRAYQRGRVAQARLEGNCVKCFRRPQAPGHSLCERCFGHSHLYGTGGLGR